MISTFPRILSAGLILLLGSLAYAADRQTQATWEQLPALVLDKKISTVLTDSTLVEGRVVAVMPDTLVVKVGKTTEPARFTGTANIPRELVSSLGVARPGWKWQVIGPIGGFVVGAGAGGAIGASTNDLGPAFTGSVIGAIGGIVAGWALGHHFDRHTTVISIAK